MSDPVDARLDATPGNVVRCSREPWECHFLEGHSVQLSLSRFARSGDEATVRIYYTTRYGGRRDSPFTRGYAVTLNRAEAGEWAVVGIELVLIT